MVTNEEWIRSLPRIQLAARLLRTEIEPEYDEDFDGDFVLCGERLYYVTSDGERFWDDYNGALEHECWWLAQSAEEV